MGVNNTVTKLNLHYGVWVITNYAKKLGIFGLLGFTILISCCLFYMGQFIPLQQKISLQQVNLAEHQLDSSKVAPINSNQVQIKLPQQQTTIDDIAKFYAMFPEGASLPQWLNLIAETALKQRLVLNRGDYKLTQKNITKTKQGQLARYEIVLPVVGQYTQIRQFIAEIMFLMPALALSDLQIKRENSLSPTVEARLVFVQLLQGDSW